MAPAYMGGFFKGPAVLFRDAGFMKNRDRQDVLHVCLHEPVEGLGAGIELVVEMFSLRSHCPRSPRHSLQARTNRDPKRMQQNGAKC